MEKYTDEIIEAVNSILPSTQEDWQLVGVLNKDADIYTFGSDSKIIGRLFEIIAKQYLEKAGDLLGYELYEATQQTVYPDFYFEKANKQRIAIDIKSTYRKFSSSGKVRPFNFTQGSFTSYLRNNTKNIDGTYDMYDKHYVLGFVYTRFLDASDGIFSLDDLDKIKSPYKDVEIIFMEKYRIGGDKKGSGNTDNIATFKSNSAKAFNYGAGPFAFLGKDIYEHYWRNYPKNTDSIETKNSLYNSLPSYFDWLEKKPENKKKVTELKDKYKEYLDFVDKKKKDQSLN